MNMINRQTDRFFNVVQNYIGGFHQCYLSEPMHLEYVSSNLCAMAGYSNYEFTNILNNIYTCIVHPEDIERYENFLMKLSQEEGSESIQYRMVHKNGKVSYVSEVMSSKMLDDGTMHGYSVVTDLSNMVDSDLMDTIKFIEQDNAYSIMTVRDGTNPNLVYYNDRAKMQIGIDEDTDPETIEYTKENLIGLVAVSDRAKVLRLFEKAYNEEYSGMFHIKINDIQGRPKVVTGWLELIKKGVDITGSSFFVVMEVSSHYNEEAERHRNYRSMNFLQSMHSYLFEINPVENSIKLVHAPNDDMARLENIRCNLSDITDYVCRTTGDDGFRDFIGLIGSEMLESINIPRHKIEISRINKTVMLNLYRINDKQYMLCCDDITKAERFDDVLKVNEYLKCQVSNIKEGIRNSNAAMIGMQINEGNAKIMYVSDAMISLMGKSSVFFENCIENEIPVQAILGMMGLSSSDFDELVKNKELRTQMYKGNDVKPVKVTCNAIPDDKGFSCHILMKEVEDRENDSDRHDNRVFIRAFGHFEVYIDGRIVMFKSKKAKELLALLVDRRGSYLSAKEAISYLWEGEPIDTKVYARYRKTFSRLKEELDNLGIEYILENNRGKKRIVPENFECDYYDYLNGSEGKHGIFKGSYMSDYSWSEYTLSELLTMLGRTDNYK